MISAVISTLNPKKEWLQKAIDSCAGVDEVVLVNDGSDSFDINQYTFPKDVAVQFINNEKNIGTTDAYNKGIAAAKGDWITCQADDDYYINLQSIIDHVNKTSADVVTFYSEYFGLFAMTYGRNMGRFDMNINDNCISGSSFFRKEVWEFLDGLQLEVAQDWDFWNRALKSGFKFEYIDVKGIMFRISERSSFERYLKTIGRKEITRRVQENYIKWKKKRT